MIKRWTAAAALWNQRFFSTILRPPIVSVMGHVDHGKTSLLDFIRKTNLAAKEAGGITQHIGAFHYTIPSSSFGITFFDTPGHEAFSQMRKRGVQATDIVVLVVALDDGVMPQTLECIKLVRESQPSVALIVALNKCDKFSENASKVKQALLKHEVQLEEFGGEVQCVAISATLGMNVDKLLECIQAQAEVMDLQADESVPASGMVIETKAQSGLGMIASVVCLNGLLKVGDYLVAGGQICRIRSIKDCNGASLKVVKPGIPVEIAGWKGIPTIGEAILQVSSEREAERMVEEFQAKISIQKNAIGQKQNAAIKDAAKKILARIKESEKAGIPLKKRFWDLEEELQHEEGENSTSSPRPKTPIMQILLAVDVAGSEEALRKCIQGIPQSKVKVEIIKCSLGTLTPNDLEIAEALNASIFTFNLSSKLLAREVVRKLEESKVKCFHHRIIYDFVEELKKEMLSLLPPIFIPSVVSRCRVKQVFVVEVKNKKVFVAGCRVEEGGAFQKITKSSSANAAASQETRYVRVVRGNAVILEKTFVVSLRHLKEEVSSVPKGMECGVALEEFGDFLPGDWIEIVKPVAQVQTL